MGLLGAGLFLPHRLVAAPPSASRRRFLFLFCDGGWDTGCVFTPLSHIPDAGIEADAATGSVSGITFVDHPERPSVRSFLTEHGGQTCILNGIQVKSITHERCRRLILTGKGEGGDDWPSILAGHASLDTLMPHLILDGPAYTSRYTDTIVRVGDEKQLSDLLSGEALEKSETPILLPSLAAEALEDAFVAARAGARGDTFGEGYREMLSRVEILKNRDNLSLPAASIGCERDLVADCSVAFDAFSQDLTRCAMLRYRGWCAEGWDTHQDLSLQSINFEGLFSYLTEIMADLQSRSAYGGGALADEVTIVVFSEMGRAPQLNSWEGKDHWTYTSAMLLGSGIRGGQVIGGLSDSGQGLPVDPVGGEHSEVGVHLEPHHLGATLLSMGDVDPAEYMESPLPIDAVLL